MRCSVAKIACRATVRTEGESTDCFALDLPNGARVFVPVRNAGAVLRPLASKEEAATDLEILRQKDVDPDRRAHRQQQEEQERVLRDGDRVAVASHLRRLYAKKTPATESQMRSIRTLERLVLDEIALVLGLSRDDLEAEMRQRHPIFARARAQR